jgi:hypothetical protein
VVLKSKVEVKKKKKKLVQPSQKHTPPPSLYAANVSGRKNYYDQENELPPLASMTVEKSRTIFSYFQQGE